MRNDEVRGLLLAGGRSKRMGRDKRLLPVGSKTFVSQAYEALREVFGDPWVLVADEQDVAELSPILGASTRFLLDRVAGQGPLAALAGALDALDRPYAFLLATDMPQVTSTFLRDFDRVRRSLPGSPDVVVGSSSGFAQVTCAFYQRRLAQQLWSVAEAGEGCLVHWLKRAQVDARQLDHAALLAPGVPDAFENVNTPADHERYLRGRSHDR